MKKLLLVVLLIIPVNVLAFTDTARSTIVMDTDSGRILYEKNANEKRLIASITKIMTAVLAIENTDVNRAVVAGDEILSMYGSSIYIELGEKMTIKDLLYGLMLRSGNDAAVVIAKNVSGNEEKFVELMNKKAKDIGMINTIYRNPHGLDENTKNYSTAKDMALLSKYANKLDLYKEIVKTKKWTVSNGKKTYLWNNRNQLLYTYKYTTGGKTGYTPSAGRTLVTTASKDNLNLTIVTLNDGNEYITHESLYEHFFSKYKKYLIVDKNNFEVNKNFFKDNTYIKENFSYPLSTSELKHIKTVVRINKESNYKNNEKVGEYLVFLDKKQLFKTNIYVKLKNKNKSIIAIIKDVINKIFKR